MFFHAMYAPFRIGDRVEITASAHNHVGEKGKVTRRNPEDPFDAEGVEYFVTFDEDQVECPQAFGYWDLALLS